MVKHLEKESGIVTARAGVRGKKNYSLGIGLQFCEIKKVLRDFPGGAVVENPPANAGNTSSILGPGRSHMPWSN